MSTPAPICVDCHQEMKCTKNHKLVHDPKVGGFSETYWIGDEYACQICKRKIVTGFARRNFLAENIKTAATQGEVDNAIPFAHSVEHRHLLEQYGI